MWSEPHSLVVFTEIFGAINKLIFSRHQWCPTTDNPRIVGLAHDSLSLGGQQNENDPNTNNDKNPNTLFSVNHIFQCQILCGLDQILKFGPHIIWYMEYGQARFS